MIDPKTLIPDDKGIRLVYRGEGNTGAPEYAELIGWTDRHMMIRVQGDSQLTKAYPIEVVRA